MFRHYFSRVQLQSLSSICESMAQVAFASVLIEPIISGHAGPMNIIGGLIGSASAYYVSFTLASKSKY